jgi:hypothetical protein
MSAKAELFDRLTYLSSAVNLPDLIDNGVAISEHNGRANLLRKGLGIVSFNILEDFIKNRSVESLAALSGSRIQFSNLTESLREAATLGAVNALNFRAKIERKEGKDFFSLIQDEALNIHSTRNPTFKLSKFSLVSTGSNVGAEEVKELLSAFGIKGGWGKLKEVSDAIGGGLPDLSQTYKNAAERRHSSAHAATFQYSYQWLSEIKGEILAICAALDILLAARCRQVLLNPRVALDSHDLDKALNFRFLEPKGRQFREVQMIGGRSRKTWSSLEDAVDALQPTLAAKNEFLILLDHSKRIADWHV